MTELKIEVDPAEVGFDAARLARIDTHFARYVDDGFLPGWLIVVARGGQVVHLSTHGWRDMEAGLPVETDTVWRIYSMTKPITAVAAMVAWEQGLFELNDDRGSHFASSATNSHGIDVRNRPAVFATMLASKYVPHLREAVGVHTILPCLLVAILRIL
jgi:CubicO group peptidase (beta-lactamase class C family)